MSEAKEEQRITWVALLTKLRDEGVTCIAVLYAGSGDSGAIEHVGYLSEDETQRKDGLPDPNAYDSWDEITDIIPDGIEDITTFVKEEAYEFLNNFNDWWNNDGGQGVFLIDTKTGNWFANNGTNRTVTEYTLYTGKMDLE